MTMRNAHLSSAINRDAARALVTAAGESLGPTKQNGS